MNIHDPHYIYIDLLLSFRFEHIIKSLVNYKQ